MAEWFGEAPANLKACAQTADKTLLRDLPRRRPGVLRQGPVLGDADARNCRDDRGDVCMDYSEWVQAWTEIKG